MRKIECASLLAPKHGFLLEFGVWAGIACLGLCFRRRIRENGRFYCHTGEAMNTTERIPQAMAEKFSAIAALTDAFCAQHLHAEYRQMILHVLGVLARKRPSPLIER